MVTYKKIISRFCPLHYSGSAGVTIAESLPVLGKRRRSQGRQLLSGWEGAIHAETLVLLQNGVRYIPTLAHWGIWVFEGEVDIAEEHRSTRFIEWFSPPCRTGEKA